MKRLRGPFSPLTLEDERREPYLQVFLLGFVILFLAILPVVIFTRGYFIYYGDFNSQQIPFYYLAHQTVREGAFGWNWQTDLGANFIGSYSFYLLGSPFFWLTVPFSDDTVLYLMPYLLALKHAVAALTSYAFIRRFVRNRQAAMIGALLYAFSGFQLFNIFFNHFQDVTAFFPLLLIAMEQRVNENRRGIFAVTVAFMAILNYYFFTGQAVFVILYFIFRCGSKDFQSDLRKYLSIALEAVIGVLLAAFMLLPSALAIIENYRTKVYLFGLDMVAYSDRTRLWHIIQSFFMLPDSPARPNLFQTDYGKWASIGGYLPLFSMAGVIAFMSQKRKHWATKLTAVSILCAMIPVLNSAFYLLNGSYYARWYYMPILIMAMMTAYALDNPKIKWRGGITFCALAFVLFGAIALLPIKNSEGNTEWFSFAKYPWYFWLLLGLCSGMLVLTGIIASHRSKGKPVQDAALWLTVGACLVSSCAMIYFGIGLGAYPTYYVNYAIKGGSEITLEEPENQFFRVDISEDYDNYPMLWGYSNMRCFHSIVPTSLMDFYDEIGITRDVASRADHKAFPLRALFNVKYYFDKAFSDKADTYSYQLDMPGFTYLKKENGFYIYENEAYIPMGVAYDRYVSEEAIDSVTALTKEKTMLKALILNDAQIAKYQGILEKMPDSEKYSLDDNSYTEYCREVAETRTCDTFSYDSYGFTATITLDHPQLVFFSVPYESGWTATVNEKEVDVEKVDYGFMAVRCEDGDNTIEFHYHTPGLREGLFLSADGLALLIIYLILTRKRAKADRQNEPAHKYCYDYEAGLTVPVAEHSSYLRYARYRRQLGSDDPPQNQADEPDSAQDKAADPDTDSEE